LNESEVKAKNVTYDLQTIKDDKDDNVIINGNCQNNTLERPRVTIADPGLTSFRSSCSSGPEDLHNLRRLEQSSETGNVVNFSKVELTPPVVIPTQRPMLRYDLKGQFEGQFDMRENQKFELRENQNCGIPGSHQRPPPPQYRRSDYIFSERDFDEGRRIVTDHRSDDTRRIMTLDRRRIGGSSHQERIRSFHAG
jgi:hypothetical protein